MQDLKIEYRDGRLVELSIDGVSFLSASAISFSHTAKKDATNDHPDNVCRCR